jgi:hypothetical protein
MIREEDAMKASICTVTRSGSRIQARSGNIATARIEARDT